MTLRRHHVLMGLSCLWAFALLCPPLLVLTWLAYLVVTCLAGRHAFEETV